MNTARFPDHHSPTTRPARSDRDTGSAAGPDPPPESAERIVDVRDGLTIVAPSDPPRLGPLAGPGAAEDPARRRRSRRRTTHGARPAPIVITIPGVIVNHALKFAFYAQAISETGRRAVRPIHEQQLADATTCVQRHGGQIVADYFDVYPDGRRSWDHRRE